MLKQRQKIAAAMHDVQNQHHIVFSNTMDDQVIVSGEAAQARAQIVVTPPPQVWMSSQ